MEWIQKEAKTLKKYMSSYVSDLLPDEYTCFGQCNKLTSYDVTRDAKEMWTFRLFCKKACQNDEVKTYQDCLDFCSELCRKNSIHEDQSLNQKWMDRSPACPETSRRCYGVCVAACEFRHAKKEFSDEASKAEGGDNG